MDSVRTMLLIDNRDGEKELAAILNEEYQIVRASNSKTMLDLLVRMESEISFVIINLDLAELQGYKSLELLLKEAKYRELPVIATGQAQDSHMEAAALELGAWDYIAKPYYARTVRSRLKMVNEHSRKQNELYQNGVDGYGYRLHQLDVIFSKLPSMIGIFEYYKGQLFSLSGSRVINCLLCTCSQKNHYVRDSMNLRREDRACIWNAMEKVINTQNASECCFWNQLENESKKWLQLNLYYLKKRNGRHIILYTLEDKTDQMEMEQELRKYKAAIFKPDNYSNRILIVDDQEMNRVILKEIFRNHYDVLEACNGKEAIEILSLNHNDVDVILLDLMMPVMDGSQFLEYKNSHPEIEDIPVVVITADASMNQQVNTLALGADDYIVKPFVVEVVLRRIRNVLESHRRFREVLREYNNVAAQAREDPLTKLFNRAAAQEDIIRILNMEPDQLHALIMLDVDKFKTLNDTYGHKLGDDALTEIAAKIKAFFRDTDIVSRFGGDEFCVFMRSISSPNMALEKCIQLCKEISKMKLKGCGQSLSVSVGIAVTSSEASSFDALYRSADKALYVSKQNGRNQATLYAFTESEKEDSICSKPR